MKKILCGLAVALTLLVSISTPVLGQITNPALSEDYTDYQGATSGKLFAYFFVRFWNVIIIVGAFAFMINFIVAAYEWLGAGGDKSKLQKAQERITQGLIGLIILVSSYTIIGFISYIAFGEEFNILNPFENFSVSIQQTPPDPQCVGPSQCSGLDRVSCGINALNGCRWQ